MEEAAKSTIYFCYHPEKKIQNLVFPSQRLRDYQIFGVLNFHSKTVIIINHIVFLIYVFACLDPSFYTDTSQYFIKNSNNTNVVKTEQNNVITFNH